MRAATCSETAVESALAQIVRRDAHVVRLRHGGDFLRLHDSACVAGVRLDDVGGVRLENLAKALARIDPLADGDRDIYPVGDLLQGADVERVGRFLDP